MADNDNDILSQIRELQADYQRQLPEQLSEITRLWSALQRDWHTDSAAGLYGMLHKLAGSGASFGCAETSHIAKRAEQLLAPFIKVNDVPAANVCLEMSKLLAQLVASLPTGQQALNEAKQKSVAARVIGDAPLLYLLEDDPAYAKSLALQLQSFGYQTACFVTIMDFQQALDRQRPALLMVDIMLSEGEFAGTQFIQQLRKRTGLEIPVVVFSERTDFDARLNAVRAGAAAYFSMPVEIDSLIVTLDKLTFINALQEPLRILIIDDDQRLAAHYALVLSQAGMKTDYLTEPELACQKIAEFRPDLIISDIYMPGCTGVELAGLIRQHPQYMHIPIVFLSTETQLDTQLQALKMGGDDFLTKPIDDAHLIQCIQIRALRARSISELMVQDSLTGLLKHAEIKEHLKLELSRAKRNSTPLSFAMIDIDHFKKVNDQYGHLLGDRVIKSLSRLLRTRFRQSDIVGRYGGEEFAVILPECAVSQAKQTLEDIRKNFSLARFKSGNTEFSATFSAGIAQFPDLESAEKLIQAADKALYQAKNLGRNRVEISTPAP